MGLHVPFQSCQWPRFWLRFQAEIEGNHSYPEKPNGNAFVIYKYTGVIVILHVFAQSTIASNFCIKIWSILNWYVAAFSQAAPHQSWGALWSRPSSGSVIKRRVSMNRCIKNPCMYDMIFYSIIWDLTFHTLSKVYFISICNPICVHANDDE